MNYQDFARRHRVTKSITLALEPYGATRETIRQQEMLELDAAWHDKIRASYPILDAWAIDVMNKALSNIDFDFQALYNQRMIEKEKKKNASKNDKKSKDDKKEKDDKELTAKKIQESFKPLLIDAINQALPADMTIGKIDSTKFLVNVLLPFARTTDALSIDKAALEEELLFIAGARAIMSKALTSRRTAMTTNLYNRIFENFDRYCANISTFKTIIEHKEDEPMIYDFIAENPEIETCVYPSYFGMLLTADGIEWYNRVLSGTSDINGTKAKGLNQILNEVNAKNQHTEGYKGVFFRAPKALYKLPLMPREKQYIINRIESDDNLITVLDDVTRESQRVRTNVLNILKSLQGDEVITTSGQKLHTLSQLSGDHNYLPFLVEQAYRDQINHGKKVTKALQQQMDKAEKETQKQSYTLTYLSELAEVDYLNLLQVALADLSGQIDAITFDMSGTFKGNRKQETALVKYYDLLGRFSHLAHVLTNQDIELFDAAFYDAWNAELDSLSALMNTKRTVQAYILRKPKDMTKRRQAFFGTMSRSETGWWHQGKRFELMNCAIIRMDEKFYYYIQVPGAKRLDIKPSETGNNVDFYSMHKGAQGVRGDISNRLKKTCDKYFIDHPDQDSMTLTAGYDTPVTVSRELYQKIQNKAIVTQADIQAQLHLFRKILESNRVYHAYDFSELKDHYDTVKAFCDDADKYYVNAEWTLMDRAVIEQTVASGEALMFLITNRFMYTDKAYKNTYATMFLNAMSDENILHPSIRLNSRPMLLYRPQVLKDSIVHHAGSWVVNKRDQHGNPIDPVLREEIYKYKNHMSDKISAEAKDLMDTDATICHQTANDLIKDRRYTHEQFSIQFSYIRNFTSAKKPIKNELNYRISDENVKNRNTLTVIRGAADLLYYLLTDANGKIIEKKSLNVINGFDYMQTLKALGADRRREQQTWQSKTTVKTMKEGYLSHAITEIAKIAYDNQAVICIEAIDDTYKNRYACLDNQVFKTFETQLIARLSDLHFRNIPAHTPGGAMNTMQLTDNTGNAYQDGIVFFMNGAYTTNMDHQTGFYNLFKVHNIKTKAKIAEFFGKFDEIVPTKDAIKVTFDYRNFMPTVYGKPDWTVYVRGGYTWYDREAHKTQEVKSLPQAFLYLLRTKGYDLEGRNLVDHLDTFDAETLNTLLKYLKIALFGYRKALDGGRTYVSPITGDTLPASEHEAIMLQRKFMFHINQNIKGKDQYVQAWFTSQQNQQLCAS